jgi:hypothetical protein
VTLLKKRSAPLAPPLKVARNAGEREANASAVPPHAAFFATAAAYFSWKLCGYHEARQASQEAIHMTPAGHQAQPSAAPAAGVRTFFTVLWRNSCIAIMPPSLRGATETRAEVRQLNRRCE